MVPYHTTWNASTFSSSRKRKCWLSNFLLASYSSRSLHTIIKPFGAKVSTLCSNKFIPILDSDTSDLIQFVKMEVSLQAPENLFDDYINEADIRNTPGIKVFQQEAEGEEQVVAALTQRVCSNPSGDNAESIPSSFEEKPKKKKVNVTVTVISVAGVHIKDTSKSKKNFMSRNSSRYRELCSPPTIPSTTITASFSCKDAMAEETHVASLPVQLSGASSTFTDIIRWSKQDGGSSLFHFQQDWLQEDKTFWSCTAHLAISRSGRRFNVGRAVLLVREVGESFVDIPITNELTTKAGKGKKVKMKKLKGESLKCGLDHDALLRVKVHVSEPLGCLPESTDIVLKPSFRQYATPVPPSEVRSTRECVNRSIDCHSHSTGKTSKMSGESSQATLDKTLASGIEINYETTEFVPSSTTAKASLSKADNEEDEVFSSLMGSFSGSDSVSSLGEKYLDDIDRKLTWRNLFTCQIPVCGIVRRECADIDGSASQSFYTDDEPTFESRTSSYTPW